MASDTPKQVKQEPDSQKRAAARTKPARGTLPKGGMSPLADREDPDAWTARQAPLDAREVRITRPEDSYKAAPDEPVGGWVDGTTDGKLDPRESLRKRMVAVKNKEYPDMAARSTSSRRRADVKIRMRKAQAAAEAAAEERQEEDRNYQDAVKDISADDEGYDDGDT